MEVMKEGTEYKLFHTNRKDFIIVPFLEKVHINVPLKEESTDTVFIDGVVQFKSGITNEEIWYMMLDRVKYLNNKHYSKYNDIILKALKIIIGATKDRKRLKQENKKRYENSFQTEFTSGE